MDKKITYLQVHDAVKNICIQIGFSLKEYEGIYPIPRGGNIPAAFIAYKLNIPIVSVLRISKDVLIVDDCIRTGTTISNDKYKFCDKAIITVTEKNKHLTTYYGIVVDEITSFPWENI